MNVNFDITTEEGRKNLIQTFDKWGWGLTPSAWLLKRAYDLTSNLTDETIKAQKEAVIEMIKVGKENGVGKMTIAMDQTAGIDFGGEIEGFPIKIKVGKIGKLIIEVEYKAD